MTPDIEALDETRRLDALRKYGVLDTPPEQALDELTALAATICQVPIALISLVDDRRQWFKSKVGIETEEMPRDIAFCGHALCRRELLIVPDATEDVRFTGSPLVTGSLHIRFYAGAPLVTPEGAVLGTLCVMDRVPRELAPEQKQALLVFSHQVMTQLELRRRGRELEASESKLRAIFEAEPEGVKLLGTDATLHEINAAGLQLIEADSLDALAGKSLLPLVVPEDQAAVTAMLDAVARGARHTVQFRLVSLKSTPRWVEMSGAPFRDEATGRDLVLSVSRDITARKKTEEKVQRLNRLYAVSSSINEAIVRIRDTQELYEQACRIAVERGGLVMAWVGLPAPEDAILTPVARWGRDDGYLDAIRVLATAGEPEGQGPAGVAFRTGAPACCNDIASDPGFFASRVEALRRGYRSCAAFPLALEGRAMGVLVVYGDEPACFDREELHVLNSLAENISFAIESHRNERQRLEAEAALRASEARYRTLFECAPDGILIADSNSYYLDANATMCRLLGYTHDEMVGRHARDIVAPRDAARIAGALREIDAGFDHHGEWRFVRKDGSLVDVEVTVTTMAEGHLLVMIRDITERKRNEARFRRLVDSNAQGVIFWSADGAITGANDAFLRLVGYSREDLENGRLNWIAMTPPEYTGIDRRCLGQIAGTGICPPYEKEYLRKDGSRVPVLIGAAAFEDNPAEGLTYVLDLTERKNLERQFLRGQRMESIGTLAGGIAHDLNNSLGPIIMSLDLLKLKFTDPSSQELLGIIATSAHHGADMVRQVLSFARGAEGRRMEVQIRHLIQDLEKIANDTFLKHIVVKTEVARDLWTVLGDPTQLHQLLLNLCVNARDAMPGGGTLTLAAHNVTLDAPPVGLNLEARPGPYVFLRVEDTGTGMRPEVMDRIFDPFFTTKELGKGTGLGLSTSLAIVTGHGGFMSVASEPGQGTKFDIHLPAQLESGAEADAAGEEEMPRGHGELILVIDDEASVRRITQETLKAFGYCVVQAAGGAEGVAIYESRREEIAAVLTDMMMPGMDGMATIQALLHMNPKLRIIAGSGLATDAQIARTFRLGVADFLSKPYSTDTLLRALRRTLSA